MRIIAGSKRRMPLKAPDGRDIRPTTDRIKETLFNMLQGEIEGAVILDLFAGSGGIGLEALSRGAAHAVFIDKSRKAADCIRENIAFTRFEKLAKLHCADALSALRRIEGRYVFDIIFMDPPYASGLEIEVLRQLCTSDILSENTRIIIERALEADDRSIINEGYIITKVKKYKTNKHVWCKRESHMAPGGFENGEEI